MEVIVSIIIPHFNRFKLIKETIASVQNQSFTNWELIIVDDGTSKNEYQLLEQYVLTCSQMFLKTRVSKYRGPSACRNEGAAMARGKYLIFLDSDDLITADCLEKRVEFMNKHSSLDFAVFTQGIFQNKIGDNDTIFSKFFSSKKEYLENFISDNHPWQTSAPIWKKDSFYNLKGFREDYTIMEDPEFHIRALLSNCNYEVIKDKPDFYYRMTPKNAEETNSFWKNSIIGRVSFFKEILILLRQYQAWPEYKNALCKGYFGFIKNTLLYRCNEYPEQLSEILSWAKMNNLISSYHLFLINLYVKVSKKNNFFLRKGLIYKLIN